MVREPDPGTRRLWLLAGALTVFAASRMIVLFAMGGHISDVGAYWAAAAAGVLGGQSAYAHFWFPYPPLALLPVYLPAVVSGHAAGYTLAFRLEMLLFDLLVLGLLMRLLADRLELEPGRIRLAVYLYGVLGLAVGHLLYDRLDLVIAAVFLALVTWLPNSRRAVLGTTLVAWAGILFKLVPLFWLPLLWLAEWVHRADDGAGPRPAAALGFALRRAALQAMPPALVLWLWNLRTGGGLWRHLGEHAERGIEIESLWATPIWVWRVLVTGEGVPVVTRWGGQHLDPWLVSDLYLGLAKYSGFALLALLYAWLAARLWRRRGDPAALPHRTYLLAAVAALLLLIATQRVLSPQYLVWALPGLAALTASWRSRGLLAALALVYLLTFELFGRSYWDLAAGQAWPVVVLALRNAALLGLTGALLWRLGRQLRRSPPESAPSPPVGS